MDLEDFPKLRAYLEERKEQIADRHVAEKNPRGWYRTIDRIYPELTYREKLLIPDIKGDASIVYEKGELYPPPQSLFHHLGRVGRARASGRHAVGHRPPFRGALLYPHAGRVSALSGAVPSQDQDSEVVGR
ncbi:hypothetical protein [Erythrobacter sp. HL-111]|uniref:hypothetical protein n=1 Tax=Erythrobacter sp. HL-111 TaxID=1798193 RepID=UPI0018D37713|nr:hypothetical protein [Erythrobacter sp. HL-111]